MTVYTYVGVTPRFLSSGRPITFGTELQESDLQLADDSIKAHLAPPLDPDAPPSAPLPAEEPAPVKELAPVEESTPVEEPAPAETPAPAEAPSLDPQPADAPPFSGRGS